MRWFIHSLCLLIYPPPPAIPTEAWASASSSPTFSSDASLRRDDLARGYRTLVGEGKSTYGKVAVCDVAEPPLLVGGGGHAGSKWHYEQVSENTASVVLALLAGDGHLVSPSARDFLVASDTALGTSGQPGKPGKFGYNLHAMSWDDTYDADRHVPWEMTTWQLWDRGSACFKAATTVARMDSLYASLGAVERLEREKGSALLGTKLRFGSLLTAIKIGAIPAWEFDIDIYLFAQKKKCAGLKKRFVKALKWDGWQVDTATNGYAIMVKPPGLAVVFKPHWVKTCNDLRLKMPHPEWYSLSEEMWVTCRARMRNDTLHGKTGGYESSTGYSMEADCIESSMAGDQTSLKDLGGKGYSSTSRPRHVRVAIASWDASKPVIFLGATTKDDGMLYNEHMCREYGEDTLGNPWNCNGEIEFASLGMESA